MLMIHAFEARLQSQMALGCLGRERLKYISNERHGDGSETVPGNTIRTRKLAQTLLGHTNPIGESDMRVLDMTRIDGLESSLEATRIDHLDRPLGDSLDRRCAVNVHRGGGKSMLL